MISKFFICVHYQEGPNNFLVLELNELSVNFLENNFFFLSERDCGVGLEGQQVVSNALELWLQVAISYLTWVLRAKLGSSASAVCILKHSPLKRAF